LGGSGKEYEGIEQSGKKLYLSLRIGKKWNGGEKKGKD